MNYLDLSPYKRKRTLPEKRTNVPKKRTNLLRILVRIRDLVRPHPIPLVLCVLAPIFGIFGLIQIAIGLYVGAGLYVLSFLIDGFFLETDSDSRR